MSARASSLPLPHSPSRYSRLRYCSYFYFTCRGSKLVVSLSPPRTAPSSTRSEACGALGSSRWNHNETASAHSTPATPSAGKARPGATNAGAAAHGRSDDRVTEDASPATQSSCSNSERLLSDAGGSSQFSAPQSNATAGTRVSIYAPAKSLKLNYLSGSGTVNTAAHSPNRESSSSHNLIDGAAAAAPQLRAYVPERAPLTSHGESVCAIRRSF
jgi:hypothetical protein